MFKNTRYFLYKCLFFYIISFFSLTSLKAATDSTEIFTNPKDIEAIQAYTRPVQIKIEVKGIESSRIFLCRIGNKEDIPITIEALKKEFPYFLESSAGNDKVKIIFTILSLSEPDQYIRVRIK
jgi:hypothetical protein